MSTHHYEEDFEELKGLDENQQKQLIEKAEFFSFNHMLHRKQSLALLLVNYSIIIVVSLVPPFLLGFSLIINGLFLGLGLIISGFASDALESAIKKRNIKKGLKHALSENQ